MSKTAAKTATGTKRNGAKRRAPAKASVRQAAKVTHRQRIEEKEEAIVAAAHDIFVAQGYEGARMAEIARQAGVAEGTVYLYFASKRALLDAVLARVYAVLTRDAAEGVEKINGTFERLDFLARHHLESVATSWRIFALTAHNSRYSDEYRETQVYELNRQYVTVFDRIVREGMNRGDIRDSVSLANLRDMFYGGLDFALRSELLHTSDPRGMSERVIPEFMQVLIAGIAAPGREGKQAASTTAAIRRLEKVATRLEAALENGAKPVKRKPRR